MNNRGRLQVTLFADTISKLTKGQQRNQRRFIGYLRFPVQSSSGRGPNTIFVNSLGATSEQSLPTQLKAYYDKIGRKLTTFEYEQSRANQAGDHHHDTEPVTFDIDAAVDDVVTLIDRFHAMHGPQNLLAVNVGAAVALRAALARPHKLNAIGLLAPVLGISVSYMDQLCPGSSQRLAQGYLQQYPCNAADSQAHQHPHYIGHDTLMNLIYGCPVNHEDESVLSDLHVPVTIVHGTADSIVHYDNSVRLADKLERGQCKLVLVNKQSHFFHNVCPEVLQLVDGLVQERDATDELLSQVVQDDEPHVICLERYTRPRKHMIEMSAHA